MLKRSELSTSSLVLSLSAATLYVVGGLLVKLPLNGTLTYLFWAPAGFAFAALWWMGKRGWMGVVLGSLLVSLFVANDQLVLNIAPIALVVALEALIPVWWLRHQGITDIFADAESILKFIVVAVLLVPIPASGLGVLIMWANGLQPFTNLGQAWFSWWVGDSMGVLLLAPFLLALPQLKDAIPSVAKLEELLAVGVLLLWLWFQLFMTASSTNLPPLSFVTIPLIIWVAVRFNIAVLTSVLFMLALNAIHSTAIGHGPFVRDELQDSIAYLYGFVGVLSSIGLFLGVTVANSRRNTALLAQQNIALYISEEGLRKTLESAPHVGVQWYDKDGHVLYWNQASELFYGWSRDEALGKTADQLTSSSEGTREFCERLYEVARTGQMIGPVETTIRHRNGNVGQVLSTIFAMPEADGIARRFVCIDVDITKLKQAETALMSSHQHLTEAQAVAKLGSWEWDAVIDRVTGSAEYYRIYGLEPGTTTTFAMAYEVVHPDDKSAYINQIAKDFTYPNTEGSIEFRIVRADGEICFIHAKAKFHYDATGNPLRAVGTIQDVTERRQAQAEIERLAYYDELTGLPNRRLLLNRLTEGMQAALEDGEHVALLFVDVDHFKTLNDTHGHEAGDLFLKLAGERIQQCLYKGATVARPSGDEFGVVLPKLQGDATLASNAAMTIAKSISELLTKPFDLGDHVYHSTASIGAVIFSKDTPQNTLQELLKQADTALFRAKDTGRNAICFFESHMQEAVAARSAIEQDLRQALSGNQLMVYLQPQTNQSGLVVGAECLLRWQHPTQGLVSPAAFIPIAESTGLIVAIGNWVLHQACSFIAKLDAAGQSVRISVNVSPRQFRQHDFVLRVKEILALTGAEPQRLILEITESVVVENVTEVIARMAELERLGIGFSIDDFGTGYSSLSYLKHMPLRELKIDKSFVDGLPRDLDDGAIVGSILALAQNLNLEVVAEGIETTEQLEYLKSRGCEVFQGYLQGRPIFCEELIGTLLAR